jgi:hypothetical protein
MQSSPDATRRAATAIAVALTVAASLPVVHILVPTAIARYRTYHWEADARQFHEATHWGRIHFGEGPPYVKQD